MNTKKIKSNVKRCFNVLKQPKRFFVVLGGRGFFHNISDEEYLKKKFKIIMGRDLNLDNPQTYEEKLQYLKIYDRNPLYTRLVDKYEVRKYVEEKIGAGYLIPLLGLWNSVEEIDFSLLPDQFAIKCTHDSHSAVLCNDKSKLNLSKVKRHLSKKTKRNMYWSDREWPYKDVKPRILAEALIIDKTGPLKDYKIFCFDGSPRFIQVDIDRYGDHKRNFYDLDWNLTEFRCNGYKQETIKIIEKPQKLDEMINIAKKLSSGLRQCRVDLYYVDNTIYFGEITFFHGGGYRTFLPEPWPNVIGSWINLQ